MEADDRQVTTEDLDIYRSAHLYIREHGEDAAIEAAKMIDAMLAKGDLDGQRVWRRILAAIRRVAGEGTACWGCVELRGLECSLASYCCYCLVSQASQLPENPGASTKRLEKGK